MSILGAMFLLAGFGAWLYDLDTYAALLSTVGCVMLIAFFLKKLTSPK